MTDELIRKSDALAAVHLGDTVTKLQARIATLPAVTVRVPTEAQIASACLSYDHSFGLMDGPQRVAMMHQAREWLHAWRKEFAALEPMAAPDLTDPVTVHANMLRGTIAKPTVEQIIHLYGVDALTKALAPVIVREAGIYPVAAPDRAAIREAMSFIAGKLAHDPDSKLFGIPRHHLEAVLKGAASNDRAIAGLPAVTVGVKPLVWQHEARNGWKVGVAWTTGYHIIRRDDGWHYGNGAGGIFPTIEAAKAAAQADYTDRILSALEPATPDPAAIREAAARTLLDMLYMRNGAQNGMTRDDVQRIWDAASTREGYAAVEAFLLALIPTKGATE